MTVGEKIQTYRKALGMSQEELGQRLLVSRQTISQWETDQTMPTLDNLLRLREVFGVSVDEILGIEKTESVPGIEPRESYQFHCTEAELKELTRLERRLAYKRPIVFFVLVVVLIVAAIASSANGAGVGFLFGMGFLGTVAHIKGLRTFEKMWKKARGNLCRTTYEYRLFEDHMRIAIYRDDEKVRESKHEYADLEGTQQYGKWLFFQFGGQSFLVRRSDLKENSMFFSHMYRFLPRPVEKPTPNKWRTVSTVLFIASILSLFVGAPLVANVSEWGDAFLENMWLFFLLTPIPISSIIVGFVMKSKGYKYKKNVVVGIIMTVLLCLYGSFTFLFSDVYNHSDEPILKAERTIGIDIPEYRRITTQDWTKMSQSAVKSYIYSVSDVHFDDAAGEAFEKQLKADERWLSAIPNDLIGIISPWSQYTAYDYSLLYNMDTSECNTLPDTGGTFRFLNLLYRSGDNEMRIVEYKITYVK